MSYQTLLVNDHDAVRVITLNRPNKRNAINVRMCTELSRAIEAADADNSVRVIVVTGSDNVFTAGVDLSLFLGQAEDVSDLQDGTHGEIIQPLYITRAILACRKPVIAAVNGLAVGMGVTILPHFDLIYASDNATFSTPFVKLGLVVEFGASYTLPRLIGTLRTNEMILRGTPIDALTANEWGLCARVFPQAVFLDSVINIAKDIAANPPGTVSKNKQLLRATATASDVHHAIALENEVLATCYGSEENAAAATAILRRR